MNSLITFQDIKLLVSLQSTIMDSANNPEELLRFIQNSIYVNSQEGISLIIHEIFTALTTLIDFNHQLINFIVLLSQNTKFPIKDIIIDEVMSTQPICVKKVYLYALKQLLKEGLFSIADIEDFSLNYRHCSREELFIVFYTFAPDLCKKKSDIYIIYYEKFHNRFMFNAFDVILVDFDKYAENDWALLDKMLTDQVETDSLQYALKNDNLEMLIKFATDPTFDMNKQLFYSIFSPHDMLSSATPIEICAFFSSIKCFKYLLVNEASTNGRLSHYAVAGGNIEIVRLCSQQEDVSVSEALPTAVWYRRLDISEWIVQNFTIKKDVLIASLMKGASWDSVICLEKIVQSLFNFPYDDNIGQSMVKAADKAFDRSHKTLGMYLAAEATSYEKK